MTSCSLFYSKEEKEAIVSFESKHFAKSTKEFESLLVKNPKERRFYRFFFRSASENLSFAQAHKANLLGEVYREIFGSLPEFAEFAKIQSFYKAAVFQEEKLYLQISQSSGSSPNEKIKRHEKIKQYFNQFQHYGKHFPNISRLSDYSLQDQVRTLLKCQTKIIGYQSQTVRLYKHFPTSVREKGEQFQNPALAAECLSLLAWISLGVQEQKDASLKNSFCYVAAHMKERESIQAVLQEKETPGMEKALSRMMNVIHQINSTKSFHPLCNDNEKMKRMTFFLKRRLEQHYLFWSLIKNIKNQKNQITILENFFENLLPQNFPLAYYDAATLLYGEALLRKYRIQQERDFISYKKELETKPFLKKNGIFMFAFYQFLLEEERKFAQIFLEKITKVKKNLNSLISISKKTTLLNLKKLLQQKILRDSLSDSDEHLFQGFLYCNRREESRFSFFENLGNEICASLDFSKEIKKRTEAYLSKQPQKLLSLRASVFRQRYVAGVSTPEYTPNAARHCFSRTTKEYPSCPLGYQPENKSCLQGWLPCKLYTFACCTASSSVRMTETSGYTSFAISLHAAFFIKNPFPWGFQAQVTVASKRFCQGENSVNVKPFSSQKIETQIFVETRTNCGGDKKGSVTFNYPNASIQTAPPSNQQNPCLKAHRQVSCTLQLSKRCTPAKDAVQQCLRQKGGCLAWSAPKPCIRGSVCNEGSCEPLPPPPQEIVKDPYFGLLAAQGGAPLGTKDAANPAYFTNLQNKKPFQKQHHPPQHADTPEEILLPPGIFVQGSPPQEVSRWEDEIPHRVLLTNSFFIRKHEVTQGEFEAVMTYNPSHFRSCRECPVENVSWHEAASFSNALSRAAKLPECFDCRDLREGAACEAKPPYRGQGYYACLGYRLPTEAEWEYAYRAGTHTALHNNTNLEGDGYTCSKRDAFASWIAWYCANSQKRTQPVGKWLPNLWGIHDMAGNVSEWVYDRYEAYPGEITINPVADPSSGKGKGIRRGGDADSLPTQVRAAFRGTVLDRANRSEYQGFRVVRTKPSSLLKKGSGGHR